MHISPFPSRSRVLIAALFALGLVACAGQESGPQSNVATSAQEPDAGQASSPERVTPVIRRAQ